MTGPESRTDHTEERFLAIVDAMCAAKGQLSPLGAAIVAARHLGIASDTRSFARILGVEHALVLRELTGLTAAQDALVSVKSKDDRTQRTHYALTAAGQNLVEHAM